MNLKKLSTAFSIYKVKEVSDWVLHTEFCFFAKTDDEMSLVCPSGKAQGKWVAEDNGWWGFRVEGALDFSQVGILAQLTNILKNEKIPVFVVSTFDTDYIFIKEIYQQTAINSLKAAGHHFC